ncbi:MAG: toll-Interleukin receptor, partial [Oligoflexia bacterium]|nr:toll-Interleukin receptor [Oligoflexia bacterium]
MDHILALPTDAKPIKTSSNKDEAWNQVCKGLTEIADQELQIRKIKIKSTFFNSFLNNTEILSETHSQKTKLLLKDIFIYPNLKKYSDQEVENQDINAKNLIYELIKNKKILISGQGVSGKTTLCKTF